ncbi:alpha/beta fold hydrolase [Niallia circulans]|uniref:alpha/beta fold hydrolase n=1 Tax=Niallia circulans TaxID=1397 RepID=UPI0015612DFD|nr:alpha/beta hydrolase [Niallia circulans]NRG33374.1 alpha/beta hydrolase [Niallia circulans]
MNKWARKLLNTSRGKFEIFIKGQGEPLCITHHYAEFNETGDYFAESFVDTHEVFLVNLREAGSSDKATQPYELGLLESIFDLEAIREALGFKKWNLAGHSTGGILGVIYGIYCSNSLRKLVLVGAAAREYMTFSPDCIYNDKHPSFKKMQDLMEKLKRSDLSITEKMRITKERTKLSLYTPENYGEYFSLPIQKKISSIRLNYFSREVQLFDVTRKLKLISTPTLIICGKFSFQCPLSYSLEMNECIPHSKLLIFNQSNHYPFLEEASRFKDEIDAFMGGISCN